MSELATEGQPLNPPPSYEDSNPSPAYHKTPSLAQRESLSTYILYGLSFIVSLLGLACAIWGWFIARTAPFDKDSKRTEIDSYEKYFYGMMSIYSLLSINLLWTGMNIYFLREGKGKHNDISDLNAGYDFLIWATLIAFGVLNMVTALWDRRLCDGWGRGEEEMYERCDAAQFRLLVVELVAVNLGLLVAVVHFILLIARCCSQGQRGEEARSGWLRLRIREEEDVLRGLLERRRLLEEEVHERELPALPTGEVNPQDNEEDLIDVGGEQRR